MKAIKKIFRNAYAGEEYTYSAEYQNGTWKYTQEYVEKINNNQGFDKKAVIIGNGISRLDFNLGELKKPSVKDRIQTYGCNALYRDFNTDFLICTRTKIANELKKTNYCQTNIVYASSHFVVDYPGYFFLIPQDPHWNSGSMAAYLACFDGHPTIYLIGFDGNDTPGTVNNVYLGTNGYSGTTDQNDSLMSRSMIHVFKTYPLVDFVLVNSSARGYIPASWQSVTNLRRITYRDFVLECDL